MVHIGNKKLELYHKDSVHNVSIEILDFLHAIITETNKESSYADYIDEKLCAIETDVACLRAIINKYEEKEK